MPRYFFHIYDGQAFRDHEGTVLPNLQKAKEQATRAVAGALRDRTSSESPVQEWCMDVVDGTGKVLLRLELDLASSCQKSRTLTYLLNVKPGSRIVN